MEDKRMNEKNNKEPEDHGERMMEDDRKIKRTIGNERMLKN